MAAATEDDSAGCFDREGETIGEVVILANGIGSSPVGGAVGTEQHFVFTGIDGDAGGDGQGAQYVVIAA